MSDRLAQTFVNLGKFGVMILPGLIVILCMPIGALMHESIGLVGFYLLGFFLGMLIAFSMWLMNKLIWIFTGRVWLDDIL